MLEIPPDWKPLPARGTRDLSFVCCRPRAGHGLEHSERIVFCPPRRPEAHARFTREDTEAHGRELSHLETEPVTGLGFIPAPVAFRTRGISTSPRPAPKSRGLNCPFHSPSCFSEDDELVA